MAKGITDLIKLFIFWLLFFACGRALFIFYHWDQARQLPGKTVAFSFYHGLPLDISAACYLLIIPLLIILYAQLFNLPQYRRIIKIYMLIMIMLVAMVTTADLQLYREWGSKVGMQALSFLRYPAEVIASVSSAPLLLLLALFVFQLTVGIVLLRLFRPTYVASGKKKGSHRIYAAMAFVVLLLLLFTGIRGGWQLIPVNQSAAYFSDSPFANHASLNTPWNLFYSISNTGSREDIELYRAMHTAQAAHITDSLYAESRRYETVQILAVPRPNVVFIILESWTADVVESLGGEKNCTPEFEKLLDEGLLFTNIYASGDRTDKGLVAVMSGFPAQPASSIVTQPEKVEKLPGLTPGFNRAGYSTSFYYGGESEFANMKAYLLNMKFRRLTDKTAFKGEELNSKWGAHDHIVFERAANELAKEQKPFFSVIMTLSSHEPFEIPVPAYFEGKDEATLFRNSVRYSDQSLGAFIRRSKEEGWYDNTLFVLVADHGHRLPRDLNLYDPRRFRIPLLITGGALKPALRGTLNETIGSQTDIPFSILSQLGMPAGSFNWSRDIFSGYPGFAFYTFNNGFGWVEPGSMLVYDNISRSIVNSSGKKPDDAALLRGLAYLQHLMEQYLK